MTEQCVLDAKTLYECSSDFRCLIACWGEHKRCPLPLVDFLIEQGLESQAEGARWAATEGRYWYDRVTKTHIACGPFPQEDYADKWYWFTLYQNTITSVYYQHDVKASDLKTPAEEVPHFAHVHDALLWLLDNWRAG
jgi:hypothetical protein